MASMACSCCDSASTAAGSVDAPAQGPVEQFQGLQRLTQIVAGGGEKSALALVRPIGAFARAVGYLARSLGGLAGHDELGLDLLAVGHVADGGGDEGSAHVLDRAQADFDGKLRAVAPPAEQIEARPHGAHAHVAGVILAVSRRAGRESAPASAFRCSGR